eukprot:27593_1
MVFISSLFVLLGCIGVFGAPTSPTHRPTNRPTDRPTSAYQNLYVWYNITTLEDGTVTFLETVANKDTYEADLEAAVKAGIIASSSTVNTNSDFETTVEDVELIAVDNQLDVKMNIGYFHNLKQYIRASQDGDKSESEASVQSDLRTAWNDSTLQVNVDSTTIKVTSNGNMFQVIGGLVTVALVIFGNV